MAEPAPPSRAERTARGRALRAEVPRSAHAEFTAGKDREDALDLLRSQEAARVPELLPIRYGRMAVSPFTFFRGAALPMASDLSRTPRTGIDVQLCGDAHLANFGVFASPERRLVFDLNDFDETLPGPWEWDVKRLATSLEIAARDNGFSRRARTRIVRAAVAAYRSGMAEFAACTALDVWYTPADVDSVRARFAHQVRGNRAPRMEKTLDKARSRDNLGALSRFAGEQGGTPRIIAEPPLIVPVSDLTETGESADDVLAGMREVVLAYRESLEPERRVLLDRYRLVDMARKVVGVGSVGTRSWMMLLLGDEPTDPLFLQAKEAGPSVLERYLGGSEYPNSGQRVVVGQRMMQAASDIFLGWVRVSGFDEQTRDFYLRQLRDWKGSADVGRMAPKGMQTYGELCGWTLARAHARTGDPATIAGYLGSGPAFDAAVRDFAAAYADRNELDHAALVAAIGAGRIEARNDL
ncbi:MAG: DUF2252 domain-containing protein [Pseudonocardia sp.]|nr:DUF2252 domain-containing protein [Pseudonocardia sp.]